MYLVAHTNRSVDKESKTLLTIYLIGEVTHHRSLNHVKVTSGGHALRESTHRGVLRNSVFLLLFSLPVVQYLPSRSSLFKPPLIQRGILRPFPLIPLGALTKATSK